MRSMKYRSESAIKGTPLLYCVRNLESKPQFLCFSDTILVRSHKSLNNFNQNKYIFNCNTYLALKHFKELKISLFVLKSILN